MATSRERLSIRATAAITMDVTEPATVALQLAMAGDPPPDETLEILVRDVPVDATVLASPVGGRQHLVRVPAGTLRIRYDGTSPGLPVVDRVVTPTERIEALRPSRYCPADRVLGLAAQFAGGHDADATIHAICDYVAARTVYTAGASGASTDAVETLLTGQGVCRDYAHAVAMLARAAGIPSRIASVYAPGLSPMDMHAVVEAEIDGVWRVFDATRLAPRHSLARIATGRDAADTAFLTVLDGRADLEQLEVSAVVAGDLPGDDHHGPVSLP